MQRPHLPKATCPHLPKAADESRLSPGQCWGFKLRSSSFRGTHLSLHTGPFGVLLKGHAGYAGKPQELGLTSLLGSRSCYETSGKWCFLVRTHLTLGRNLAPSGSASASSPVTRNTGSGTIAVKTQHFRNTGQMRHSAPGNLVGTGL